MKRYGIAVLGAMVAACAFAAAPAGAVRMTHTVTIEGELVNNWTVADPSVCGDNGRGTLTVKFKTTRPTQVLPYVDRFQRAKTGRYGAWLIGVSLPPNLIKHMPYVPITGTITRVDNTTRLPDVNGDDCTEPNAKTGCGTVPLRRGKADIAGYDRTRILAAMVSDSFLARRPCLAGSMERWNDFHLTGGPRNAEGDLIAKMPRPAALKRRSVVRAIGRSHKRTTFSDLGDGDANEESGTNDVTRKIIVTFRRR
jgi:hypothetical protein